MHIETFYKLMYIRSCRILFYTQMYAEVFHNLQNCNHTEEINIVHRLKNRPAHYMKLYMSIKLRYSRYVSTFPPKKSGPM